MAVLDDQRVCLSDRWYEKCLDQEADAFQDRGPCLCVFWIVTSTLSLKLLDSKIRGEGRKKYELSVSIYQVLYEAIFFHDSFNKIVIEIQLYASWWIV